MTLENEYLSVKAVYFAHGRGSGPWGTKIQALAEIAKQHGYAVESPDFSGMQTVRERLDHLLSLEPKAQSSLILVGSSMGAFVMAQASEHLSPNGLFLMAPAVYISDWASEEPKPTADRIMCVHGWRDSVVPVENAIRYCRKFHVPLLLVDSEHTLTEALPMIERQFDLFLTQMDNKKKTETLSAFELEMESKFKTETFFQQKSRIPK